MADDTLGCSRVKWLGVSSHSAGSLLAEPPDPDDKNRTTEAAEWLTGYLKDNDGEVVAREAIKAARADGISERTLKRARKQTGVSTAKSGEGPWVWRAAPGTEDWAGMYEAGKPYTGQDDATS